MLKCTFGDEDKTFNFFPSTESLQSLPSTAGSPLDLLAYHDTSYTNSIVNFSLCCFQTVYVLCLLMLYVPLLMLLATLLMGFPDAASGEESTP